MHKSTKTWLIIAISLILIGCILFGGALTMLNWDFSRFTTEKFETNTHTLGTTFQNITIVADTANIRFVPTQEEKPSVVCYEYTKAKHTVEVIENTLTIRINDERKWYEHIGIHFKNPTITVSLPLAQYGTLCIKSATGDVEIPKDFQFDSIDITESTGHVTNRASALGAVRIKTITGSIRVQNVSADTLDLTVSTGDVTVTSVTVQKDINIRTGTGSARITDVRCQSIYTSGTTGDTDFRNVIAEKTFSAERSTGDVDFERCDAAEVFLKTSTGDIEGSLLTEKIFIANSNTGRVEVPKTTAGGKCEVTTNTGDIEIEIQ